MDEKDKQTVRDIYMRGYEEGYDFAVQALTQNRDQFVKNRLKVVIKAQKEDK